MSGYGGFAAFYDELTGNVDYQAISGFIYDTLKKYEIDKGIVLDLACGTGSLCEVLAALGYEMIGVDGSEDMLSEAWNKSWSLAQTFCISVRTCRNWICMARSMRRYVRWTA